MQTSTIVWIIVVVVAVLALVAVLGMAMSRRRKERNRSRAGELREQATARATGVQQSEAAARETQARAEQARAEADRKAAEAERLEAEAADRRATASARREEYEGSLQRADELDPDTDHKHRGEATPERDSAESEYTGEHRGDGTRVAPERRPETADTEHHGSAPRA